jgi:hypothetical protein
VCSLVIVRRREAGATIRHRDIGLGRTGVKAMNKRPPSRGGREMATSKPTPADIMTAIAKAEAGDWIDPVREPISWLCELMATHTRPRRRWRWHGYTCGHPMR